MKTSYYQNKNLKPSKHLVVQTSIGSPRFGAQPDWETEKITPEPAVLEIAKNGGSETQYTRAYFRQLDRIGVDAIRAELNQLLREGERTGKEVVLCCFEALKKPGQYCHRRMFSDWWKIKTGEDIAEL